MIAKNTSDANHYTSYTKNNITQLLNTPVSIDEPYLTPLYFAFPSIELANKFLDNGALVHQLSFLHCYFTYRKMTSTLDLLFNFMHNLTQMYGFDCDEIDVDGRNAVAIVYEEMCNDPKSIRMNGPKNTA